MGEQTTLIWPFVKLKMVGQSIFDHGTRCARELLQHCHNLERTAAIGVRYKMAHGIKYKILVNAMAYIIFISSIKWVSIRFFLSLSFSFSNQYISRHCCTYIYQPVSQPANHPHHLMVNFHLYVCTHIESYIEYCFPLLWLFSIIISLLTFNCIYAYSARLVYSIGQMKMLWWQYTTDWLDQLWRDAISEMPIFHI